MYNRLNGKGKICIIETEWERGDVYSRGRMGKGR